MRGRIGGARMPEVAVEDTGTPENADRGSKAFATGGADFRRGPNAVEPAAGNRRGSARSAHRARGVLAPGRGGGRACEAGGLVRHRRRSPGARTRRVSSGAHQRRSGMSTLVCMAGFLSLWRIPDAYAGRVLNIHPATLARVRRARDVRLAGASGGAGGRPGRERLHRAPLRQRVRPRPDPAATPRAGPAQTTPRTRSPNASSPRSASPTPKRFAVTHRQAIAPAVARRVSTARQG